MKLTLFIVDDFMKKKYLPEVEQVVRKFHVGISTNNLNAFLVNDLTTQS